MIGMGREVENEYGCFRCGAVRPQVDINPDTGSMTCGGCGEASIVTLKQALDMLNGYYLMNKKEQSVIEDLMNYDQYYPELNEDDDG